MDSQSQRTNLSLVVRIQEAIQMVITATREMFPDCEDYLATLAAELGQLVEQNIEDAQTVERQLNASQQHQLIESIRRTASLVCPALDVAFRQAETNPALLSTHALFTDDPAATEQVHEDTLLALDIREWVHCIQNVANLLRFEISFPELESLDTRLRTLIPKMGALPARRTEKEAYLPTEVRHLHWWYSEPADCVDEDEDELDDEGMEALTEWIQSRLVDDRDGTTVMRLNYQETMTLLRDQAGNNLVNYLGRRKLELTYDDPDERLTAGEVFGPDLNFRSPKKNLDPTT